MKAIRKLSMEFVCGVLAALLMIMLYGAVKRTTGGPSGRVHHDDQLITDQTSTFSSRAFDLGESTKLIMTADFTKVGGVAPTVDCVINSGTTNTLANGDTTGTSFTQAKAATKETKTVVDGKFHQFLWATCTMAGTITTVDVAFRVTGKP